MTTDVRAVDDSYVVLATIFPMAVNLKSCIFESIRRSISEST